MPTATAASRWWARWPSTGCAVQLHLNRRWLHVAETAGNEARRMRRGARVAIWLVWLALIAEIGWGVALHLKISSDLRDFVPPARTADQKLLLDEIGKGPGSRLLSLAIFGAPQAQLAVLSRGLEDALAHDSAFAHVANGSNDLAEVASGVLPYRYLLSPALDTHRLDAKYLREQL